MPAVERVIEQSPAMQAQQQETEWRGNRRQLLQKTKDVAITAGKVVFAMSPVAVFLASCGEETAPSQLTPSPCGSEGGPPCQEPPNQPLPTVYPPPANPPTPPYIPPDQPTASPPTPVIP